jgi:hypothetical protein
MTTGLSAKAEADMLASTAASTVRRAGKWIDTR